MIFYDKYMTFIKMNQPKWSISIDNRLSIRKLYKLTFNFKSIVRLINRHTTQSIMADHPSDQFGKYKFQCKDDDETG